MSPDQSGAPCGDWDLKTLRPTVRTRTFSSWPTSRGQKYSFHWPMNVSSASVARGAAALGRTIWKKMRGCLAPSSMAASSTSRDMPRKNWRRKKMANADMNMNGSATRQSVQQSQVLDEEEVGKGGEDGGIIRAARNMEKTLSRPGHWSRANA